MNATTVQNVVTYDTVIAFDNPDLKLFPGMTAYVTIPVANASQVLEVPNSALRYKPDLKPQELQAAYAKNGIQARAAKAAANSDVAVVWKLAADKSLQPVEIHTGITDHTNTEVAQVVAGSLAEGDRVVLGAETGKATTTGRTGMPGMGGGIPRH
jgi:HlyD family secretion protein